MWYATPSPYEYTIQFTGVEQISVLMSCSILSRVEYPYKEALQKWFWDQALFIKNYELLYFPYFFNCTVLGCSVLVVCLSHSLCVCMCIYIWLAIFIAVNLESATATQWTKQIGKALFLSNKKTCYQCLSAQLLPAPGTALRHRVKGWLSQPLNKYFKSHPYCYFDTQREGRG